MLSRRLSSEVPTSRPRTTTGARHWREQPWMATNDAVVEYLLVLGLSQTFAIFFRKLRWVHERPKFRESCGPGPRMATSVERGPLRYAGEITISLEIFGPRHAVRARKEYCVDDRRVGFIPHSPQLERRWLATCSPLLSMANGCSSLRQKSVRLRNGTTFRPHRACADCWILRACSDRKSSVRVKQIRCVVCLYSTRVRSELGSRSKHAHYDLA